MLRPNLEGAASTPQESPDIVIMTGHTPLQHLAPREKATLTLFGRYAQKIQELVSISVDLPIVRA